MNEIKVHDLMTRDVERRAVQVDLDDKNLEELDPLAQERGSRASL